MHFWWCPANISTYFRAHFGVLKAVAGNTVDPGWSRLCGAYKPQFPISTVQHQDLLNWHSSGWFTHLYMYKYIYIYIYIPLKCPPVYSSYINLQISRWHLAEGSYGPIVSRQNRLRRQAGGHRLHERSLCLERLWAAALRQHHCQSLPRHRGVTLGIAWSISSIVSSEDKLSMNPQMEKQIPIEIVRIHCSILSGA